MSVALRERSAARRISRAVTRIILIAARRISRAVTRIILIAARRISRVVTIIILSAARRISLLHFIIHNTPTISGSDSSLFPGLYFPDKKNNNKEKKVWHRAQIRIR